MLAINGHIAEQSARFLPPYPRDPADQIIGATAITYGLQLVTKDVPVRASGQVNYIW